VVALENLAVTSDANDPDIKGVVEHYGEPVASDAAFSSIAEPHTEEFIA
jgi:hypothetical protein